MLQYAVTVALNKKKKLKKSQRTWKTELFISKYNWEGKNYPSGKNDWKTFEKNNLTIPVNVLYANNEKISCLRFKTKIKP